MLGNLLAYIMGAVFDDWRDSALALSAIPFLASMTMLLYPETPYWLASVGKLQESRYYIQPDNKDRSADLIGMKLAASLHIMLFDISFFVDFPIS